MAKGITEIIEDFKVLHPMAYKRIKTDAIDEFAKAIEKQNQKELICVEDKFLHCPCCDEAISYKWEKYPTQKINLDWLKFCWNCGQALKWEKN